MAKADRKEDSFEGLLVGVIGMILVIVATGVAYYFISISTPRSLDDPSTSNVHFGLWIGGIFGTFFLIYGMVGVLRGRIGVGWGSMTQVRTILTGAGGFVASTTTAIGGFLFLTTAAIDLIPEVGAIIHANAALLSGFVSIILGFLCGVVVREIGY
jgi:hypothetical protein